MKRRPLTEDWLAVLLGLLLFGLALASAAGADLLGWAVSAKVWTKLAASLAPVSARYAALPGWASLLATYAFLLVLLSCGAALMGAPVRRFAAAFTAVFWAGYACWLIGHWAYLAATPDRQAALGIRWSLNLTPEAGYIVALAAGLALGNLKPGVAAALQEAVRPELYVKTAIVLLGGALGATAADQARLAASLMFQGLCAISAAYLIFWSVAYYVARQWFGFSREWAAPLASGISVCGVSAAIATGAAIRARPVVPVVVSSLVVIFAVIELLVLPFVAQTFLYAEPMVAGAWMGLAVKTDGAAIASGAIADALIRAKAEALLGVRYQPDWITGACAMVKVFIDAFIGVWAFVLAWIWTTRIEPRPGETASARTIWERFPKFVLGYATTFLFVLALASGWPALVPAVKAAMAEAGVFRSLFFVLTFFCIGLVSHFGRLREEGIGRLALVYVVCLFGFIVWVALAIAWIFFAGVRPPVMAA
ncbi:MAG: putative sulfate exporter family transporter [Bryobacterales bacterium]|nr:YeiH family protein [Bryobacteraceae bacterium]MDW8354926.1 putative sulfate exporter family transporter [Bryobacterales bacterium]